MRMVLWDTCRKDFEPIRSSRSPGFWSTIRVKKSHRRNQRIISEEYSWLASALNRNCIPFQYVEDLAPTADAYIFVPRRQSFGIEYDMINSLRSARPETRLYVFGSFAIEHSDLFENCGASVLRMSPGSFGWSHQADDFIALENSGCAKELASNDLFGDWTFARSILKNQRIDPVCRVWLTEGAQPETILNLVDRNREVFSIKSYEFNGRPINAYPEWQSRFLSRQSNLRQDVRIAVRVEVTPDLPMFFEESRQRLVRADIEIEVDQNFQPLVSPDSLLIQSNTSCQIRPVFSLPVSAIGRLQPIRNWLKAWKGSSCLIGFQDLPLRTMASSALPDQVYFAEFELPIQDDRQLNSCLETLEARLSQRPRMLAATNVAA